MKTIEIYTSPLCGFCHIAAKRLLDKKGLDLHRDRRAARPGQTRRDDGAGRGAAHRAANLYRRRRHRRL